LHSNCEQISATDLERAVDEAFLDAPRSIGLLEPKGFVDLSLRSLHGSIGERDIDAFELCEDVESFLMSTICRGKLA
jgi:hypothetical protein